MIEPVWEVRSKYQKNLVKESLDSNINAVIDDWDICSSKIESPVLEQNASRVGLLDAAMKAWLGGNLLEDLLGTFVEVDDEHR